MEGLSNFGLVTYKSFRANLCEILSNFVASRGFNSGKPNTDLVPMFVYLFFSSRRRHTRLQGDWSSDVCSSDLKPTVASTRWFSVTTCWVRRRTTGSGRRASAAARSSTSRRAGRPSRPAAFSQAARRSEERRVGEKCRSRWSADQLKKKRIRDRH